MTPDEIAARSLLFGLAVATMFLGLAGVVLPVLPGLPLIWLAAVAYAVLDGFRTFDGWTLALLTLLALVGTGAELAVSHLGTRATGASHWAGVAAIVGGLIGLLVFSLIGALVGAMLGVFLVEYRRHRNWRQALRSSGGWLAGRTAGQGVQLALGVLMIAVFVVRVLFL